MKRKKAFLIIGSLYVLWVAFGIETPPPGLQKLGNVLILLCIAGRSWASLHIGGQKNSRLICSGPYAWSRNPLYVFWLVGTAGVGLVGAPIAGIFLLIAVAFVFHQTIKQEEFRLSRQFGDEYAQYKKSVPRYGALRSVDRKSAPTSPERGSPIPVAKILIAGAEACLLFAIWPVFWLNARVSATWLAFFVSKLV